MAVTRIGSGNTGTNTATLPALEVDDLIIVCAYRDGSATPPSVPSAFSSGIILSGGSNTNSMVVAALEVVTGTETVGTWTNATSVIAVVYRGVDLTAPGGTVQTGGASTTLGFGSLTVQDSSGGNMLVAFGGHRSTNVAITNAPSGFTLVTSVSDATDELACFQRAGVSAGALAVGSVSVGGSSSGWRTAVFELKPAAPSGPVDLLATPVAAGAPAVASAALRSSAGLMASEMAGSAPVVASARFSVDRNLVATAVAPEAPQTLPGRLAAATLGSPGRLSAGGLAGAVATVASAALNSKPRLFAAGIALPAPVVVAARLSGSSALAALAFASEAPAIAAASIASRPTLAPDLLLSQAPVVDHVALHCRVVLNAGDVDAVRPLISSAALGSRVALGAAGLSAGAPVLPVVLVEPLAPVGQFLLVARAPAITRFRAAAPRPLHIVARVSVAQMRARAPKVSILVARAPD